MQLEPLSPELVLVDPELAARERARLIEKARLADLDALLRAPRDAPTWQIEPPAAPRRDIRDLARRKLLPAALLCSLLANGFLAAELVVRADEREAVAVGVVPAAARSADATQDRRVGPTTSVALGTRAARPRALPERALVEQKLVALVLRAPARKLPRTYLDPTTGLVKDNVRVVCRATKRRSYLCVVRSPSGPSNGGVVVRYRRRSGGKETFTWYGYRRNVETTKFQKNRAKAASRNYK